MLNSSKSPLITILGPTASGKTALGVSLSKLYSGEIISCDSRQVFEGMDIGTGKDLDEYDGIPHHLIDIRKPGEEYSLFEFADDFNRAFKLVNQHNRLPFLVGGTGMYLDSVLRRYSLSRVPVDPDLHKSMAAQSHEELKHQLHALKPEQHNQTDLADIDRTIRALEIALAEQKGVDVHHWPPFDSLVIGLQYPREITRERITSRLNIRLENGLIEEVERLLKQGVSHDSLEHYGLEYRFLSRYLRDQLSYNDMLQKLNSAIHQFAKQQEKWFRNIEKKGVEINWLDTTQDLAKQSAYLVENFLAQSSQ